MYICYLFMFHLIIIGADIWVIKMHKDFLILRFDKWHVSLLVSGEHLTDIRIRCFLLLVLEIKYPNRHKNS